VTPKRSTYLGERFDTVTIWEDGHKCRVCQRVIRVRERAGFFPAQPAVPPAGEVCAQYECKDCLFNEPINNLNQDWRGTTP